MKAISLNNLGAELSAPINKTETKIVDRFLNKPLKAKIVDSLSISKGSGLNNIQPFTKGGGGVTTGKTGTSITGGGLMTSGTFQTFSNDFDEIADSINLNKTAGEKDISFSNKPDNKQTTQKTNIKSLIIITALFLLVSEVF